DQTAAHGTGDPSEEQADSRTTAQTAGHASPRRPGRSTRTRNGTGTWTRRTRYSATEAPRPRTGSGRPRCYAAAERHCVLEDSIGWFNTSCRGHGMFTQVAL